MYHFSENAISEISNVVENIVVLFPARVQKKLLNFVAEISQNKCCDLVHYREILSLLQNEEKKKKPEIEKKGPDITNEEEKKYQNILKQSEYLTIMFMTGAFISQSKEANVQMSMAQEVRR